MRDLRLILLLSLLVIFSAPSFAIAQTDSAGEVIDAAVFHKEFNDNLFAAEEKYGGKEFTLKGAVGGIGRSMGGAPEVTIEVAPFKEIKCEFGPESKSQIAQLKKGDVITVKCQLNKGGKAIVGLNMCSFPTQQ